MVFWFQSPNGIWNIFGGKLAWGPEAIVCDDPNFQGRGNPSSGMHVSCISIFVLSRLRYDSISLG